MLSHINEMNHFARHGGVQYSTHVSESEINQYVNEMNESQRESMYSIMKELERVGMISINNSGVFADGNGKIGGSTGCGDE